MMNSLVYAPSANRKTRLTEIREHPARVGINNDLLALLLVNSSFWDKLA
jgi:hypothetical protein